MSKEIFSATVSDNGLVRICGSGNVMDLVFGLTVITRSIHELDILDDDDREFIKDYVQNHLGRLAYMDSDELDEELAKLAEEITDHEKKLDEAIGKLFKDIRSACDGSKELAKKVGNALNKLLKEMGEA